MKIVATADMSFLYILSISYVLDFFIEYGMQIKQVLELSRFCVSVFVMNYNFVMKIKTW